MTTLLVKLVLFCLFVLNIFDLAKASRQPQVLLISFDGFRWNYLSRTETPWFDQLICEGVKAKWIQDVYVTQTFPNHYTIATGMYEETHGIVANQFFDPSLNKSFSYVSNSSKDPEFWGGEPIWITNQMQNHNSGVYFWVGSEVKIKSQYPTVYEKYNSSISWTKRVNTVVDWLSNKPIDGKYLDINLALLYFSQPDHAGHKFGPESDEVTAQIKRCDDIIGYLIGKLKERELYDAVNIIITSDHGMASLNKHRKLVLYSQLDENKVERVINLGVAVQVWPKPGEMEAVYAELKHLGSNVIVYKKEDIPRRFHYSKNIRISPIFVMVKDGWFVVNHQNDTVFMNGSHGFDNTLMDMHPFFIAHGPAFKVDYISEPFSNIHIYSLICYILNLIPSPNDGSLEKIQHLLAEGRYIYVSGWATVLKIVGVFVGVFFLLHLVLLIAKLLRGISQQKEESNPSNESNYLLKK